LSEAANRALPGEASAWWRALPAASGWSCVLVLVCLLVAGCSPVFGVPAVSPRASLINKKAPEFSRKDLNGNNLVLRSLRSKVVLLNFWATWCAPCLVEMPIFAKWQQQYGSQGLQVVGISMDDDSVSVRRVLSKLKLNYPIAMGDAALGERYGGVLGLPLTYLIDRKGVVRAQIQGETDVNSIEKQLKLILAQP
jgi:cytochrome c biogenesis protein CcmG/thiol:disulfide interchange protein DsbE